MFNYQPRVEELELLLLSLNKRNYTMTEIKSQIEIIDPIMDNNLDGYEPDECEYAPKKISKIEAIIYDWVVDNFGTSEAMSPSWNITMLAEAIHENLNDNYEQSNTVVYENEGEYDDEDDE